MEEQIQRLQAMRAELDARFVGQPTAVAQLEQALYQSYCIGFGVGLNEETRYNFAVAAAEYAAVLAVEDEMVVCGSAAAAAVAGYMILEELLRWGDITALVGCRRDAHYYTRLRAGLEQLPPMQRFDGCKAGAQLREALLQPEAILQLRDFLVPKCATRAVDLSTLPETYANEEELAACMARAEAAYGAAPHPEQPLPMAFYVLQAAPEPEQPQPEAQPAEEVLPEEPQLLPTEEQPEPVLLLEDEPVEEPGEKAWPELAVEQLPRENAAEDVIYNPDEPMLERLPEGDWMEDVYDQKPGARARKPGLLAALVAWFGGLFGHRKARQAALPAAVEQNGDEEQ